MRFSHGGLFWLRCGFCRLSRARHGCFHSCSSGGRSALTRACTTERLRIVPVRGAVRYFFDLLLRVFFDMSIAPKYLN